MATARDTPAIHRHYFILHATCILCFNFYHSRSDHIVFLPRVAEAMASGVTLPELRAMHDLSRQADRRVAQLGLADSSDSD